MELDAENLNPSAVTKCYWLYALRKIGEYPEHTDNGGKWLIFVDTNKVDNIWMKN